ncbi:hypothetical protein SAY86_012551 [Trapa natans]|uniref:Rhodanese domain-containing protein n=1 Tax=Trapa natans TaxID=22666 RepID=A0AAN7MA75_TRANT|nr:hypothetical protein SAY86_012551 [Trapa natans]
MTMLPVCSATTSCSSSHCQIPPNGGVRTLHSPRGDFEMKYVMDSVFLGSSSGKSFSKFSFKTQVTRFSTGDVVNCIDRSISNSFLGPSNELYGKEKMNLKFVQGSEISVQQEGVMNFAEQHTVDVITNIPESMESGGITSIDVTPGPSTLTSDPQFMDNIPATDVTPDSSTLTFDLQFTESSSSSEMKTSIGDIVSSFSESLNASVENGQNTLSSSLDSVNTSISSIIKSATGALENAKSGLSSTVEQVGESAGVRLTDISRDFRGALSKSSLIGVDVLRRAVVAIEDSFGKGASFVVYSYSSAKEFLPSDIKDTLNVSEAKTAEILQPVGAVTQQVSFAVQELERNLGLDPSDPIVSFVLFLGTASALWAFYWVWTYSGYSGDLSPRLTFELLMGKENAVLIDVRPEILRETDGIPDLRRTARFRYSSVSLPEVDSSLRKLLKNGRDVEDGLIAAVIRNLKVVGDRSKVILMDSDGTRSKGIARSLRKLGIKRSYLVEGGFRSWASEGLRIKGLKPETALTILNEEAEAILEEINPSPLQIFASGVGLVAGVYALTEWEKTLQLIGVFGLGQTIYRRFASYQDPEDFKQDLRQLLVPVKLGAQAFSWAAGKLETNGIGLPTSPSSSDVQNRVLQAAARHESQPSEDEGSREFSPEPVSPSAESGDLSEA